MSKILCKLPDPYPCSYFIITTSTSKVYHSSKSNAAPPTMTKSKIDPQLFTLAISPWNTKKVSSLDSWIIAVCLGKGEIVPDTY